MNNLEEVNNNYRDSLEFVQASTGLELRLIEKARLKEIVEDAVKRDFLVKGICLLFSIS